MNYYKWPVKGISSHSYYWGGGINFSANFSETIYDWANMLDTYSVNDNTSSVNCQAVSTLAYHCGVSVEMQYAADASGAPTSSIPEALINYFGYDKNVKYIASESFTPIQWKYQIMLEVTAKRPVIIAAYIGTLGHAYIADGYDSYEFIHLNWGWDGLYNGYFELDPIDGSTFLLPRGIVIGVQKPQVSNEAVLCYKGFGLNNNTTIKRNLPITTTINVFEDNGKSFNGDIGLAFYKNGAQYEILNSTPTIINTSSTVHNSFSITVPDTLTAGTYQLVPIFKSTNSTIWSEIKYKNTTLSTDTRISENLELEVSNSDLIVYQNSKTMHCKKGDFKNTFSYADLGSIQRLVVSGEIDQWDMLNMAGGRSIKTIDINGAIILDTEINPDDLSYGGKPANFGEYMNNLSSKWKNYENYFWHGINKLKFKNAGEYIGEGKYLYRGMVYDSNTGVYGIYKPSYTDSQIPIYTFGGQGLIMTIGGKGIMADAFNNSVLENITLPRNLKYLAPMAFANCPNLKTITLPDSVALIGDSLFYNCPNLSEIKFSKRLKNIWNQSFPNLKKLTSVILPDSLLNIEYGTFESCKSLKSITIPSLVNKIENATFRYCSGLTSVVIPSTVKTIGWCAFYQCIALTSIAIPSSVNSIGDQAFSGCTGLTSIIIPSSVKTIEHDTFIGCSGLTSVSIPNSVTSIGYYAFSSCKKLTSIVLPLSLSSIGSSAFSSCLGLTGDLNIPKSVVSIGDGAFANCNKVSDFNVQEGNLNYSSVEGVLFNKNKTTLINFPGAKQGKYSIPNSVTSIEPEAFYACSGLTSITIPSSVLSIHSDAFGKCSGLNSIYVNSKPINLGSLVFSDTKCTLYVPYKTKNLYAVANQWKDFTNIVESTKGFLLSSNSIKFNADKNSTNIDITANEAWTINSDQTWLKASHISGSGDDTLTLTAQANTTSAIRTAIVTVLDSSLTSQTITVTQVGLPKLINITAGNTKCIYKIVQLV